MRKGKVCRNDTWNTAREWRQRGETDLRDASRYDAASVGTQVAQAERVFTSCINRTSLDARRKKIWHVMTHRALSAATTYLHLLIQSKLLHFSVRRASYSTVCVTLYVCHCNARLSSSARPLARRYISLSTAHLRWPATPHPTMTTPAKRMRVALPACALFTSCAPPFSPVSNLSCALPLSELDGLLSLAPAPCYAFPPLDPSLSIVSEPNERRAPIVEELDALLAAARDEDRLAHDKRIQTLEQAAGTAFASSVARVNHEADAASESSCCSSSLRTLSHREEQSNVMPHSAVKRAAPLHSTTVMSSTVSTAMAGSKRKRLASWHFVLNKQLILTAAIFLYIYSRLQFTTLWRCSLSAKHY